MTHLDLGLSNRRVPVEFSRQVKEDVSQHDDNNPSASVTSGESAAFFNAVMDCVNHEASSQEVWNIHSEHIDLNAS